MAETARRRHTRRHGGVMSDYDNTVAELTEKLTGLGGIVTR